MPECDALVLDHGSSAGDCGGLNRPESTCDFVACDAGYDLSSDGAASHYCMADGSWWPGEQASQGVTGYKTCIAVTCAAIEAPDNGKVAGGCSGDYAGECTYSCDPGWELAGNMDARVCGQNGEYTGTAPSCTAVECTPLTLTNGVVIVAGSGDGDDAAADCTGAYDEVCEYASCNAGYELGTSGDATRTCQQSSTYAGVAKECEDIDACALNPCDANAIGCNDLAPPNGADASGRSCIGCTAGYAGDGETCADIDACDTVPCDANSEGCTDKLPPADATADGRTCGACTAGYAGDGDTCTDINACDTTPCDAQVLECQDAAPPADGSAAGRQCIGCNAGFTGDGETCADINACDTFPCDSSGCTDVPAGQGGRDNADGRTCASCGSGFVGTGAVCAKQSVLSSAAACQSGESVNSATVSETVVVQATVYARDLATPLKVAFDLPELDGALAVSDASVSVVSVGSSISATDGSDISNPTMTTDSDGASIAAQFGSLQASGSNNAIVLALEYTIVDAGAVSQGKALETAVEATYSPDGNDVVKVQVSKTVSVVEPSITLVETVKDVLTAVEAGDVVAFEIKLTYDGDASSTAFDATIKATLPSTLTRANTPTCTGSACSGFAFTANSDGFTFTPTAEMSNAASEAVIAFEATVSELVTPGTDIADASYTLTFNGLPPSSSDDSSGCSASGGRAYPSSVASDSVVAKVAVPSGSLVLSSTTQAESSGTDVSVHESVVLAAEAQLAAGRSTISFQFVFPASTQGANALLVESVEALLVSAGSAVSRVDAEVVAVESAAMLPDGKTLEVVLGALNIAAAGDAADQRVQVSLSFTVSSAADVQDQGQLPIVGTIAYDNDGSLAIGTITLGVVEPSLNPTVECTPAAGVEVGSVVKCVLTLAHGNDDSTAAAYDVAVTQTLGAGLQLDDTSFVCTPACNAAPDTAAIEAVSATKLSATIAMVTLGTTQRFEWDLIVGPVADVQPDEELTSAIAGTYNSVPAAANAVYTGRGYTIAAETLTSQTKPLVLSFAVDSTSITETEGNNVAPGETVFFALTVEVPAASTDLTVVVTPSSKTLEFQAIVLQMPLDAAVTLGDDDDEADGTITTAGNAEFVISSLSVASSGAAPLVFVVEALVLAQESDAAVAGDSLVASATVSFRGQPLAAGALTLVVVEPAIVWTKVSTGTIEGDAGDTVVVYGWLKPDQDGAVGYNLAVTFSIPAKIEIGDDTMGCVLPVGHGVSSALTPTTCANAGGTAVAGAAVGSGESSGIRLTFPTVEPGSEIQVAWWGTLKNNVNPFEDIAISVAYDFKSAPDSADETKEYAGSDSFAITVPSSPSQTFVLQSTTDTLTTGSAVTIHEKVTFLTTVSIPKVTSPLTVQIEVPGTMEILEAEVQSVGDAISGSALAAGTNLMSSISDAGGGAKLIDADFSTVANNFVQGGGGGTDNTIKVLVVLRVKDDPSLSGFSPASSVTLKSILDFTHAAASTKTSALQLVEPDLVVEMEAPTAEVDAGDSSTFIISLSHSSKSTSAAYDVTLNVYVNEHLQAGFDPTGSLDLDPAMTHTLAIVNPLYFTIHLDKLELSESVDVPFPVDVLNTAHPTDTLALRVVTEWTSVVPDGGDVTGRVTESDPASEASLVCKSMAGTLALDLDATSLGDTDELNVAVGEVLTFLGEITLPELTMDLTVSAVLPDGLGYIDGSALVVSFGSAISGIDISGGTYDGDEGVTFEFGEVVNTFDNNDGTSDDKVAVVFKAQVLNVNGNTDATALTTVAAAIADDIEVPNVPVVVVVKEPTLVVTSVTATPTTADAGDVVTFTIKADHTGASTADAYDIVLTATVPDTMEIQTTSPEGAQGITGAGNTVATWRLTRLALDDEFTATIDAVVLNSMRPGASAIVCESKLDYDSYPDSIQGEDGRSYTASKASSAVAIPLFNSFELDLVSTSLADTANPAATVGEVLYFQGTITLPELSMDLSVTASLPAGLGFLNASVVSIGDQIKASSNSLAEGDAVSSSGGGQSIVFDFGGVENVYDNEVDTSGDQVLVDFYVQVLDITSNKKGNKLTVAAVADADGTEVPADDVDVVVQEPLLRVASVKANPTSADAGDVVTFTIVVNHRNAATSDGYDLVLRASVPDTMEIQSTTGAGDAAVAESKTEVTWMHDQVELGDTYTVTLSAVVLNTMRPGAADIKCATSLEYDSYPGSILDNSGRPYTSTRTSSAVTIPLFSSFELELAGTSLDSTTSAATVIGEVLHFKGIVTLPELTMSLGVTVTIPDGLLYVNASVVSLGQITDGDLNAGDEVASSNGGSTIAYAFGEVFNAADNAVNNDDKVVIDFYVQVMNVVDNVDGKSLGVKASAFADGTGVSATDVAVVVKEPALAVTAVVVAPTTGDGGDMVQYTIDVSQVADESTADAHDIVLTATIPATMAVQSASNGGTIDEAGITATWKLPKLALDDADYSVTLVATILNTMHPNAAGVVCVTSLAYDSYPALLLEAAGRPYSGGMTSDPLTIPGHTFALELAGTSSADTAAADATVGEILYFRGSATLPELTMDLIVSAMLPTGLGFVNASVASIGGQIKGSPGILLNEGDTVVASGDLAKEIVFRFGEVVNLFDNSVGTSDDMVVVEFYGQVLDIESNKDAVVLATGASAAVDGTSVTAADVSVTLKEPVLEVTTVTADPTSGDAGDYIQYTIHVDHSSVSTSDAYDLILVATVPATMQIQTALGAGETEVTDAGTVATWRLPSLALEDDYTVQLVVNILNTMQPEASGIICDTVLDYDSYPSKSLDAGGRAYNSTLLSDPLVIPAHTFELELENTSLEDTPHSSATVGEILYFRGIATLPELTMDLTLSATLPTGLGFVSASVVSVGNQIKTGSPGILLSEGDTVGPSGDANEDVVFDFGTVINAADNVAATDADKIVIDFVAKVLNVPGNVKDTSLTVAATADGDQVAVAANSITVGVTEPNVVLTVENFLEEGFSGPVDAGDIIQYTITLNHSASSNSAAYTVDVTAVVSEYLSITSVVLDLDTLGASEIAQDMKSVAMQVPLLSVADKGVTFTLITKVQKEVFPNTPGLRMNVTGGYRSAVGTELITPSRYYPVSLDSDSVEVDKLEIEFEIVETSELLTSDLDVAILEKITYRLTAKLPEVTTKIILALNLGENGLKSSQLTVALSKAIVGDHISCANDPSEGTVEDGSYVVDFGTCSNSADGSDTSNDRIYVDVDVTVNDVESNVAGETFDSSASLRFTRGSAVNYGILESDTLSLAVVEPTFNLTTVEPSKDPFTKALEKLEWTVHASPSFGRDVSLEVVVPEFMFFDSATVLAATSDDDNFVPIVSVTSTASGSSTVVRVNLGPVAENQTIAVVVETTVYEDMDPGHAYPSIAAVLEWDTREGQGGRQGSTSASFDRVYVADLQLNAKLISNVAYTTGSEATIHEGPELELDFLVKGSYPLLLQIVAPKDPLTGLPIANLVSVNAEVGANVASPSVAGNVLQGLPTTVNKTTGVAKIDFGPMELSNTNVDEIGDDDLVKTQLRYLVLDEDHVTRGANGDFLIVATYAGFSIQRTIPLTIVEPEMTVASSIDRAAQSKIQGGDHLEFETSVYASKLEGRSGGHDVVVSLSMDYFDATSFVYVDSKIDGVDATPTTNDNLGTFMIDTLLPGQTWLLKWKVNVSMTVPAGLSFDANVGLQYDSFPGEDSRKKPGRLYTVDPQPHPLQVKDANSAAFLGDGDASSGFAAGVVSDAVVGDEIVYQIRFNVPRGVYKSGQISVQLPAYTTAVDDAAAAAEEEVGGGEAATEITTAAVTVSRNTAVVSTAPNIEIGVPSTTVSEDGASVTISLGDIYRSGYGADGPEDGLVVLSFGLVVTDDVLTNVLGKSQTVSGVLTSKHGNPHSMATTFTVQEPLLDDSLETQSIDWDAGDKVVVAHVVTHKEASTSPAYTMDVSISLPAGTAFDEAGGAILIVPRPSVSAADVACALSGDALGVEGAGLCSGITFFSAVNSKSSTTYGTDADDGFGTAETVVDQLDVGSSAIILYTVTLAQSIYPGEELTASSLCTWASRPSGAVKRQYPAVGGGGDDAKPNAATIVTKPAASVAVELADFSGSGQHLIPTDIAVGESVAVTLKMSFPEATFGKISIRLLFDGPGEAGPAMAIQAVMGTTLGSSLATSNTVSPSFDADGALVFAYDSFRNLYDNVENADDVLILKIKALVKSTTPPAAVGEKHQLKIQVIPANNATVETVQDFTIAGPVLDGSADMHMDFSGEMQLVHFDLALFHMAKVSSDDAFDLEVSLTVSGTAAHYVQDMNGLTTTTTTTTTTSTTTATTTTTTRDKSSGDGEAEAEVNDDYGDLSVSTGPSTAATAVVNNGMTTTTTYVMQQTLAIGATSDFAAVVVVAPGQEASENVCIEMSVKYSAPAPGARTPAEYSLEDVSICWGWTTATTTQTSTATTTATTTYPLDESEFDDKKGMSGAAIGGLVSGLLLIMAVGGIAAIMYVQRKREMDGTPISITVNAQDFSHYASASQLSMKRGGGSGGDSAEYMVADGIYGRRDGDANDEDDPYSNNGGVRKKASGGGDQVYGLKGSDDDDVYGLANHDEKGGGKEERSKRLSTHGGGPATYDAGATEETYGLGNIQQRASTKDPNDVYANNAGLNETRRRSNESAEGTYSNNKDLNGPVAPTSSERRSTVWNAPDNSAGVYGLEAEDPDGPVYGLANNVGGPGGASSSKKGAKGARGGGGGGGSGSGGGAGGDTYNNRATVMEKDGDNDPVYGLGARESQGSVRSTDSTPADNAMVYTVASASGKVAETSLDDALPPPPPPGGKSGDGNEGVYENRSSMVKGDDDPVYGLGARASQVSTRVVKDGDPVYGLGTAQVPEESAGGIEDADADADAGYHLASATPTASAGASSRRSGGRPSIRSETSGDGSEDDADANDGEPEPGQFDTMERQAFDSILRAEASREGSRVTSMVVTDGNDALPNDAPPDSDEEEDPEVSSSVTIENGKGIGGKGLRPIMPLPTNGSLQFKRGSVHKTRSAGADAGADAGAGANPGSGMSAEVRAAIFAAAEATEAAAALNDENGVGSGGGSMLARIKSGALPDHEILDFAEDDGMEGDGPPPGWDPSRRRSSLGLGGRQGRRVSLTGV